MGILSSLTYNSSLGRENRKVAKMQTDKAKAVPVSALREGDHLAMLEGQAWTITEAQTTGKKMPGLGVLRVGMANDTMYRIVGRSDAGEVRAFEMPRTYLVLRSVNPPS